MNGRVNVVKGVAGLVSLGLVASLLVMPAERSVRAQTPLPTVVDSKLGVRIVVDDLTTPTTMAFLGPDSFFVLEKSTGQVKHVVNGEVQSTVLDLPVNFGSERGLLGIALHPGFPGNPSVYLFWTQSSTGSDTDVLANVDLLGNRVDRFTWNGTQLTFAANIIRLRALQRDPGQDERGNHDGGILRFGEDGKLYILMGDTGRRGWLQNLACGPTATCPGPIVPDDEFGGPQPDDAHLTGVILRLNADGSTPSDNPLVRAGERIGGVVGANVQKIFAYGLRNSFGMDFDPLSGRLWLEQNGDDSFTELDLVEPGMNGGWVQVMGPLNRLAQYKAIETSEQFFGLQQVRWPPTLIADSREDVLSRLVMFEGAHYSDPEFSWRFEVAPAGIGFLDSRELGPQHHGDLFVGAARDTLAGGHIFRFKLNGNRSKLVVGGNGLEDGVADNFAKFDLTESENLLFGTNFGVGTDIRTGPNGNLYVVSITNGAVYEVFSNK